jgi:hypothetical protein
MKYINASKHGDTYWLAVSEELDSDGNWLPTMAREVSTADELQTELKNIAATGDRTIVRLPSELEDLVDALHPTRLFSELSIGA